MNEERKELEDYQIQQEHLREQQLQVHTQTDSRQADRQTDRQIDRQTDRQLDRVGGLSDTTRTS